MNRKSLAYPYLIWAAIFIIVPLFLIVYFSFFSNGSFSLENYQKFMEDYYIAAMMRSIGFAFISTVICLLLAYPLAMILAGKNMSNKSIILLGDKFFSLISELISFKTNISCSKKSLMSSS